MPASKLDTVSLKARSTGTLQGQTQQQRGAAKPVQQVFFRQVLPRFHISSGGVGQAPSARDKINIP